LSPITNAEIIQRWSAIPRAFVEAFGDEGDFAHQHLLNPTLFALLGNVQDKTILDAGCGTGYLARLLSKRGAQVVGLEPATPLFEYAIERERDEPLGIEYVQADLTTWRDPDHVFDIIIANMVLMDIPDYETTLDTCFAHLRPGGQFLVSLSHPCFEESDAEYHAKGYIAVKEYFQEYCIEGRWSCRFHRPLSDYLNALVQRGGVIQAVVEPRLDSEQARAVPEAARNLHVPSFIVIQVSKGRAGPALFAQSRKETLE
jgi:SAM-dependent methyltransferase